jgi:hypothetical protein
MAPGAAPDPGPVLQCPLLERGGDVTLLGDQPRDNDPFERVDLAGGAHHLSGEPTQVEFGRDELQQSVQLRLERLRAARSIVAVEVISA